jgi:hypothetical protein
MENELEELNSPIYEPEWDSLDWREQRDFVYRYFDCGPNMRDITMESLAQDKKERATYEELQEL